ncbi:MAG: glutamine-hydrolyzing carbamoyl-phosphate synthase small subunit, partial [Fimbriimonadales bacterium]|nr:glutamine-hydrolyzing carbamoyl-phosphate synthase small subunit [Fimbriimonadales bacterium]
RSRTGTSARTLLPASPKGIVPAPQVYFPRPMRAYLVLEDGSWYEGEALGVEGHTTGELVFNTGMTGYQEVLTDPSYAGQIVLMTYPLVGNYGLNPEDQESFRVQVAGFVVREACDSPSNWRARVALHDYLAMNGIVGIEGVDTRAITRRIRERGVMMGTITTTETPADAFERLQSTPRYEESDFVFSVTTPTPYKWGYNGLEPMSAPDDCYRYRVAILDCGVKWNIPRRLAGLGVRSIILPATTPAEEILALNPDGILLSPGPGDPARLGSVVATIRELIGKKPIAGICLGHQLLCLALGASTYKLKFGHRGCNHPVKNLLTGQVAITSHNHGYAVVPESLAGTGLEVTHIQLNDGTIEGVRHPDLRLITLQFHPEAAPGPWDSRPFFTEFLHLMG